LLRFHLRGIQRCGKARDASKEGKQALHRTLKKPAMTSKFDENKQKTCRRGPRILEKTVPSGCALHGNAMPKKMTTQKM
jgi:hypothetical protein